MEQPAETSREEDIQERNAEIVLEIEEEIDAQDEPQIISHLIRTFYQTPKQKACYVFSLGMGAMAASYEFYLGSNFGMRASAILNIDNKAGQIFISGFFSFLGASTATALISLPLRDFILSLLNFREEKYHAPNHHPYFKKITYLFAKIISAMAPIPFMYELKIIYEGNLAKQIAFSTASWVDGSACSFLGLRPYLQWMFDRYNSESEEIKIKRHHIIIKLDEIIDKLHATTDTTIHTLYELSQNYRVATGSDAEFVAELKSFLHIRNQLREKAKREFSFKKFVLDFTCVSVGSIASAGLFYLSMSGLNWVSEKAYVENSQGLTTGETIISVLDVLPICLFYGGFVQRRMEDYFYKGENINQQTSHKKFRKFINYFSLILGMFSAVPNVDLMIQGYESGQASISLIPVTALGVSLAEAKSVDLLIQEAIDTFDVYFLEDSPAFQRDFLVKIIFMLRHQVERELSPEKINSLYRAFFDIPSPRAASTENSDAVIRSDSNVSRQSENSQRLPRSATFPGSLSLFAHTNIKPEPLLTPPPESLSNCH